MTTWLVYELRDPDGTPFYVGKGQFARPIVHAQEARRGVGGHKCNHIRKLWRSGGDVVIAVVLTTENEDAAFAEERRLIAHYGRANLTNVTDGGVGCEGRSHSEETRRKIAEANRGHVTSRETKEKIAAARRGKPLSAEVRARHKDAMNRPDVKEKLRTHALGRRWSEDARARQSARLKGRTVSDEQRVKLSEARRTWHEGHPDFKPTAATEAAAIANRGRKDSPERRALLSEIRRAWWAERKASSK